MNVDEIRQAIFALSSPEDLAEIWNAYSLRLKQLDEMKATIFKAGDNVSWEHKGTSYSGTVQKVNKRTIIVKTSDNRGRWRLSPHFLTLVK